MVIVAAPLDSGQPNICSLLTKISSRESPVMTSGITNGAAIKPVSNNRPVNFPMCVKAKPAQLPRIVAIVALKKAIRRLSRVASIICSLLKRSTYHRSEKPPHTLLILDALKEWMITINMGM